MTYEVQKIRKEVERLKSLIGNNSFLSDYETGCNDGREDICDELISFIDSLQEEPISEDLREAARKYFKSLKDDCFISSDIMIAFKAGAKWKEEQFEKNRLAACDKQTEEEAEIEQSFVMSIIEKEHRQPTFDDAIKYGIRLKEKEMQSTIELAEDHAMLAGMEKMKEEMMAKAVDVEVHVDAGGYPYIPQMELYDYDKDVPLAKEGDKYKVVLIKEDGL